MQYPIIHYVNATHLCASPANETTFTFKKLTRLILLQNKIPSFSSSFLSHLSFYRKKKKEYKHPKVRLIHFKHKLKPPAIIFAKFLNPLYCKAELHILYAFFTFPFGDLYRAWRLELSREMLLTCVHNHVEIKILYIQEYTAKRKSEVRMGKDKIILLIVC